MNSRKFAASLPAPQYAALERARKHLHLRRSEAVQEALALWLSAREGDPRIARYVQGYAEHPDDAREARAMVRAWARGLEREDW